MKYKTCSFAAVITVLLSLCLVFITPVAADVIEITPGSDIPDKVTWTSYPGDEQSYALWIHSAGEYKLLCGFNVSGYGINITVPGVTLDGNNKQIIDR